MKNQLSADLLQKIQKHIKKVTLDLDDVLRPILAFSLSNLSQNEISKRIHAALDFEAGNEQEEALEKIAAYLRSEESNSIFILAGSAGTGKTSLMKAIVDFLTSVSMPTFLAAPTGRAAKVLAHKTKRNALTIHRLIYSIQEENDSKGNISAFNFVLKNNSVVKQSVYIVDEASMINSVGDPNEIDGLYYQKSLLSDLTEFIFKVNPQNKLILLGDKYQLPPVGQDDSPALQTEYFEKLTNFKADNYELHEVKRQAIHSPILGSAYEIKEQINLQEFNQSISPIWEEGELEIIPNLTFAIDHYLEMFEKDRQNVTFITYSNHWSQKLNQKIREKLYEGNIEKPRLDDLVMVVKNHYYVKNNESNFIANGDLGIIKNLNWESQEAYATQNWIDGTIELENFDGEIYEHQHKIVLDLFNSMSPHVSSEILKLLYILRKKQEDFSFYDPYLNALQLKYGYAITGHKAQGGEWDTVFLLVEPPYGSPISYHKWLYTAFTRASNRLILVNSHG